MKLREDKWLEEQVSAWANEGLIDPRQAQSILKRQGSLAGKTGLNAFTLLAALGGISVALGIILIISHNWENIPRGFKIAGYLSLLTSVAGICHWQKDRDTTGSTASQMLWLMLPLAGIGLWGQIYQLSGDSFKPLITWIILGTPLVFFGKRKPVSFLYVLGLIMAVWVGTYDSRSFICLEMGRFWDRGPQFVSMGFGRLLSQYGSAMVIVLALWLYILYVGIKELGPARAHWVILALVGYLWGLGVSSTPFALGSTLGVSLLGSALCVLFWGIRSVLPLSRHPWEGWSIIILSACLYFQSFLWHWNSESTFTIMHKIALVYVASLLIAGMLFLAGRCCDDAASTPLMKNLLRAVIVSPAVLSLFIGDKAVNKAVSLTAMGVLFAFSIWLLIEGVRQARPKHINYGIALIALVMVTRFVDYFGSFLRSGAAFIISGLSLLGLAYILTVSRKKILTLMGESRI